MLMAAVRYLGWDPGLYILALGGIAFALFQVHRDGWLARELHSRLPTLGKRKITLALIGFASALTFAKIVEDVFHHESGQFDRTISLFVHAFDTPHLDRAMLLVSEVGSFWQSAAAALAILLWCWWRRDWAAYLCLSGVLCVEELMKPVLKEIFERARPELFHEVAVTGRFDSFPSGHAMNAVALYGMSAVVVGRFVPRLQPWIAAAALALAMLVGLSRIYLGVHWSTDVLAGYAAGSAILFAGVFCLEFFPIANPHRESRRE